MMLVRRVMINGAFINQLMTKLLQRLRGEFLDKGTEACSPVQFITKESPLKIKAGRFIRYRNLMDDFVPPIGS